MDMDIDPDALFHSGDRNAEAGPSSQPDVPLVYLPPPGMQAHAISQAALKSTQDLISRLQLMSAYDRYVRPHILSLPSDGSLLSASTPAPAAPDSNPSQTVAASRAGNKGKEKETDGAVPATPDGVATGATGDDDDEDGEKGSKKKKNSYRHLIKAIPGKHSTKKDDYLQHLMLVPPKQRIPIIKFDAKTQREAFTVSLEGLKGWNINALVSESTQAREDRKKRKELKRLARAQLAGAVSGSSPGLPLVTASPVTSMTNPIHSGFVQKAANPASLLSTSQSSVPRPVQGKPRTPMPGVSLGTPRPSLVNSTSVSATKPTKRPSTQIGGTPNSSGDLGRPMKRAKTETGPFERGYETLQQPTPQDN